MAQPITQFPDNSKDREELENIVKQYETPLYDATKPQLPQTKLSELSYTAPSDEYLKIKAENELYDYKTSGEQAVRDQSAADGKALQDTKDAYLQNRDSEIAALDKQYEEGVRAVDNDAIKRGLARSSIAAVNRAELEKEYIKSNADIASSYGKKISELDKDIAQISSKLQSALNDFNLSYASKLNQTLSSLKDERDKKIIEVEKYNNSVREKQAELDGERMKLESDLYSAQLSQEKQANGLSLLNSEQRDEIYKAVYGKMNEYLASLTPQQAKLELLNHSFYRQHLSNYYYNKLLDQYGSLARPGDE
ncbi:MAG: hypothetical protein HDT28_05135 [Clostridiales bacterium]|nr:hypothetical protein [Clostridiales bacterium]